MAREEEPLSDALNACKATVHVSVLNVLKKEIIKVTTMSSTIASVVVAIVAILKLGMKKVSAPLIHQSVAVSVRYPQALEASTWRKDNCSYTSTCIFTKRPVIEKDC